MKLGYARVSTAEQTLDLQLDALHQAGCLKIYQEHASGKNQDRPRLAEVLFALRDGEDTLVVWKLDRLGRDLKHLLEIVGSLNTRQIGFQVLTDASIDTTSAHGLLIFHIFAALAQYERALIRERVLAGLAAARARGRKGGRKPKLSPEQQAIARQMHTGGAMVVTIARHFRCHRATIYQALAATPAPREEA